MFRKLTRSKDNLNISEPQGEKHFVHVDNDLNWSFDNSVDANSIFKKVRVIGKGGFGTVLEIVHTPSDTTMAAKMISEEIMSRTSRDSLKSEIELMRQIVTPYTIRYYGSVIFDDCLTMLMEFCACGSLRDLMDATARPLTVAQMKVVLHDLLIGLMMLHTKYQIVHRDIKAGNILLCKDGLLKVADFCVSPKFDQSQNGFQTTPIVGAPYWMAPEVINGANYSFPADIWSVGATAIELFEGAPPYSEFPPVRAMTEIATKGFCGFRKKSQAPPDLVDFVACCTNTDPNLRSTIDTLLKHPFLSNWDKINRQEIFDEFMNIDMTYRQKNEEEESNVSSQFSSFVSSMDPDVRPENVYATILNQSRSASENEEEEEEEEEDNAFYRNDNDVMTVKTPTSTINTEDNLVLPILAKSSNNNDNNKNQQHHQQQNNEGNKYNKENDSQTKSKTPEKKEPETKQTTTPPPIPKPPDMRKELNPKLSTKTNMPRQVMHRPPKSSSAKFDKKDILLPPVWEPSQRSSIPIEKNKSNSPTSRRRRSALLKNARPKAVKELLRERSEEKFITEETNTGIEGETENLGFFARLKRKKSFRISIYVIFTIILFVASRYSILLALILLITALYYFAYMK